MRTRGFAVSCWPGPGIAQRVISFFATPRQPVASQVFSQHTEREGESLRLIAQGRTNQEIADRRPVDGYVRHCEALGCASSTWRHTHTTNPWPTWSVDPRPADRRPGAGPGAADRIAGRGLRPGHAPGPLRRDAATADAPSVRSGHVTAAGSSGGSPAARTGAASSRCRRAVRSRGTWPPAGCRLA